MNIYILILRIQSKHDEKIAMYLTSRVAAQLINSRRVKGAKSELGTFPLMKSLGDLPAGVELYKIISIRFYKKKQFLVIFTYIRNVSNSFRNKIKKM